METLRFSSWDGTIVDHRQAASPAAAALPALPQVPEGAPVHALMGFNGLVVTDPAADIPALTRRYLTEARKLSCGECAVCMIGIDQLIERLAPEASPLGARGLSELKTLIDQVAVTSKCGYGQSVLFPVRDALSYFTDEFLHPAARPAHSYLSEVTAPCTAACPAHLDIPGYIELIRNDKCPASLELIRERCILPGVIGRACTAPCEAACVRNAFDEPLAIRLLKRAAADYELGHGTALSVPAPERREKVAIIGAGPAGLSAAARLRARGYRVTLFEAMACPGGMAVAGIPPYRLPRDILTHEIDLIRRMGVELIVNAPVETLSMKELASQGFQALFIAVGAHQGIRIGMEGEDTGAAGYLDGVALLRELHLGTPPPPSRKALIVGGGNVAMDCARSCVRRGVKEVEIIYRRSRAEMPARDEELREAQEEGVTIRFLTAPVKLLTADGRVTGVECRAMKLGAPDESGRRRPVPVTGSEFTLATDTLIAAIGQRPLLPRLLDEGLSLTASGTVAVDPVTLMTGVPGVFAGGDCVSGPAILIEAMAMGDRAAESIDCYLRGARPGMPVSFAPVTLAASRGRAFVAPEPAARVPLLDAGRRKASFSEVEGGYSAPEAMKEARRCLRCYRLYVWQTP